MIRWGGANWFGGGGEVIRSWSSYSVARKLGYILSDTCVLKARIEKPEETALRGNGSVNTFPRLPADVTTAALTRNRWTRHETSRPPLQWRHTTVEELWETVFCVGARRGYIWRIGTQLSQSRESLEADKSESEAVVRQSPRVEGGMEGRGAIIVVSRCLATPS
jgi:hypothetical protein